jgi:uncharacterized protein DUF6602
MDVLCGAETGTMWPVDAEATLRALGARMTEALREAADGFGAHSAHERLSFAVANHLARHLPRHVDALYAVVVEGDDGQTMRCDVVVAVPATGHAVVRSHGAAVVPVQHVLAVIEVRPVLDEGSVPDALRRVAAVKRMRAASSTRRPGTTGDDDMTYGVVLGYESIGIEALQAVVAREVQRIGSRDEADMLCALDAGSFVHDGASGGGDSFAAGPGTDFTAAATHEPLLLATLLLQNRCFDAPPPARVTSEQRAPAHATSLNLLV